MAGRVRPDLCVEGSLWLPWKDELEEARLDAGRPLRRLRNVPTGDDDMHSVVVDMSRRTQVRDLRGGTNRSWRSSGPRQERVQDVG